MPAGAAFGLARPVFCISGRRRIKHPADLRRRRAHPHAHQLRAANMNESGANLARRGLGQQVLPRPLRAIQQNPVPDHRRPAPVEPVRGHHPHLALGLLPAAKRREGDRRNVRLHPHTHSLRHLGRGNRRSCPGVPPAERGQRPNRHAHPDRHVDERQHTRPRLQARIRRRRPRDQGREIRRRERRHQQPREDEQQPRHRPRHQQKRKPTRHQRNRTPRRRIRPTEHHPQSRQQRQSGATPPQPRDPLCGIRGPRPLQKKPRLRRQSIHTPPQALAHPVRQPPIPSLGAVHARHAKESSRTFPE